MGKSTNARKLNSILLNNPWVREGISKRKNIHEADRN